MKLRIFSDLHLEFKNSAFSPLHGDEDVIILAGDIHLKTHAISWILENFSNKPVFYIPGNHEFYKNNVISAINHLKQKTENTNIHILNNDEFIIGDYRFIGFTMWTNYNIFKNQGFDKQKAREVMSDFKHIRDGNYSKIKPDFLINENFKSSQFLSEKLDNGFSGKTIVISHFAPSIKSVPDELFDIPEEKELIPHYATDMTRFFGEKIPLWIHGHIHSSSDYIENGTRVIANPRGYAPNHLNPSFNPNLILEV